ncbi:MAG: PEP-CTERM sorting domain-containing protein [Verrucomicrobia bacterium]|nr:PEP-CTERM sorting domain-containing protein [Verrucomicrobiota bacterium]
MKSILAIITLSCGLILSGPASAAITGQWDFNSGNLSATLGTDLGYRGDTAGSTVFTTAAIGGETANVMQFPAALATQGYILTHGMGANGGGSFVNQYSLIMDIMFPSTSTGQWRGLFQTSPDNSNDSDFFVNTSNGIGISGTYHGAIVADTWHRVALVMDLTLGTEQMRKYIDGTLVGTQTLSSGVDGRWSLDTTALLFTDEDGETASGMVNSIQIHDLALADSYILALGGATADGISLIPEPATGLLLGVGLLAWMVRRRFARS